MIQDAKDRFSGQEYSVAETVHMTGFSASAQFAGRFTLLYPSLVNAITIGGNGAYPLPEASYEGTELPYPLGIDNYESITGRAFDRNRWSAVTQYIYVGREDQPQPSEERDYYSISHVYEQEAVAVFGQNRVTERFPTTKSVYEAAAANATFRIYNGLGHETSDQTQNAIKNTHQQSLDSAAEWPTPTNLLLELPDPTPTPTETPTATPSDTPISTPGDTPSADTGEATTTGASGPGFGPLTAVTSLGGLGYLLARRFQQETEE
jgi:PGF-CTERM protein